MLNITEPKDLKFDPKLYRTYSPQWRRYMHDKLRYVSTAYVIASVPMKGSTIHYDDSGLVSRIQKWEKPIAFPCPKAKKKLHKLTGGNHTKHLMSKAAF